MLAYLVLDALSIALLAFVACNVLSGRNRKIALWAMAIVLVLAGGLRGPSVGTDTGGYLIGAHEAARASDFEFFYKYTKYSSWDSLFKSILWMTSHWTPSMVPLQLVCSALAVFPVFAALVILSRQGGGYLPELGVAVYTVLFFPASFNLIRQSIAMSFVLLAYSFTTGKRWVWGVVPYLLALGFHKSALVVAPVAILLLLRELPERSYVVIKYIVLCLAAVAVVFAGPLIGWVTTTFGMYGSYVDGAAAVGPGGRRSWLEICVISIVLVVASWRAGLWFKLRGKYSRELVTICLVGAILYGLCMVNIFFYRIGLYYLYFFVLCAPFLAPSSLSEDCGLMESRLASVITRPPVVLVISVLLLCMLFSIDYYYICKMNEVVPYVFV